MHRFFADSSCIGSAIITITGDDVKHISKVLRLRTGDEITICDSCGWDYVCAIEDISQTQVEAKILSKSTNKAESPLHITVYQGLPKSDKMDYIVQKCVELGAVNIVPMATARAVVKLHDEEKKRTRWQKIALEAAKQCGRGIIPTVNNVTDFSKVIDSLEPDALNILPYENEDHRKLRQAIAGYNGSKVNIIIGPEGGFDPEEISSAECKGINIVTLGPRILRTETAPIAAISAIMYELGDW